MADAASASSSSGDAKPSFGLSKFLVCKSMRSLSGVLVVTVFTSPYPSWVDPDTGETHNQRFSCKHDCHYCPNEPDLPRSYLAEEPGVARGLRHGWDPVDQFMARCWMYKVNGHPIDKIELLVLGGTWSEYPPAYQVSFLRDVFWAANNYHARTGTEKAAKGTLAEEQLLNETADVRIIGVTLETRPDSITGVEVQRLRTLGCTRVQLGVQHTDDTILKKINRGCYTADTIRAIKLLKEGAFKIDLHLMPDLPFSTPEIDLKMAKRILADPDLQADQWKLYPCQVVPWTTIEKWHEEGVYTPYEPSVLIDLLIEIKRRVHPWIRLNRVVRDIPNQYILGGNAVTNLRQVLQRRMKTRNLECRCIRCREVKGRSLIDLNGGQPPTLLTRTYTASGGMEYFLSFETSDEKVVFGFARLRLSEESGICGEHTFPELRNTALVRELHVYGQVVAVNRQAALKKKKKKKEGGKMASQHVGYGSQLMAKAELIALEKGYRRIAVIAGIGTREYYRKLGYEVEGAGGYMTKLIGWRARCINRIGMRRCATWSSQLSPQRRRQIGALAIAGLAVLLVLAHVLFVGSSSPPLLVTWLRRSE